MLSYELYWACRNLNLEKTCVPSTLVKKEGFWGAIEMKKNTRYRHIEVYVF